MDSWPIEGRIRPGFMALALALVTIGLLAAERQPTPVRQPYYAEQVRAARLMQASLAAIKDLRLASGYRIDRRLDPNETGAIGAEFTSLTTSVGLLEAKRTSTNPAFAALMVKYFKQAGLRRGDAIAVGASGSFPALAVATLAAARVSGLEPIVVCSVGASMYGANLPGLDLPRMLAHLREKRLLPSPIAAVSPGGEGDLGAGVLFDQGREALLAAARRSGAFLIEAPSVAESIRQRLDLYRRAGRGKPIGCFVNIGGADANFGTTPASLSFPSGLVLHGPIGSTHPERGLIFEFAARGVPVIHLLNVRALAVRNGLPVDPIPLPPLGTGGVYYQARHPGGLIVVTILAGLGVLILGRVLSRRD